MRKLSFDDPSTWRQRELSTLPDQLDGVSRLVGESVASCASFPGATIASSTAANWRSMFVLENDCPGTVGTFESPRTPHLHIALMSGGMAQINSRSERRELSFTYRPGIGCANLNGTPVRIRWASPQNTRVGTIHIFLPKTILAEIDEELSDVILDEKKTSSGLSVFDDPYLLQAGRELVRAVARRESESYAQVAMGYFARHLMTSLHKGALTLDLRASQSTSSFRRVSGVVELLQNRYMETHSLRTLAKEAGVTPFYLIHLFKQQLGSTPHAYQITLRLDAAAKKLRESDQAVAMIASTVGYDDVAHFSTMFKKRFGLAPSAFRNQQNSKMCAR